MPELFSLPAQFGYFMAAALKNVLLQSFSVSLLEAGRSERVPLFGLPPEARLWGTDAQVFRGGLLPAVNLRLVSIRGIESCDFLMGWLKAAALFLAHLHCGHACS